jgi:hypothetical protein
MAGASNRILEFTHQVKAITRKNLVLLVTRHWLSTVLQSIIAPIVVLALTLNIRNFTRGSLYRFGVGSPIPIRTLENAIPSSQHLVFVKDPSLGPDIDTVISTVSRPLAPEKTARFDNPEEASSHCRPNFRGISDCYAVVEFRDSPLTPSSVSPNQTWYVFSRLFTLISRFIHRLTNGFPFCLCYQELCHPFRPGPLRLFRPG